MKKNILNKLVLKFLNRDGLLYIPYITDRTRAIMVIRAKSRMWRKLSFTLMGGSFYTGVTLPFVTTNHSPVLWVAVTLMAVLIYKLFRVTFIEGVFLEARISHCLSKDLTANVMK